MLIKVKQMILSIPVFRQVHYFLKRIIQIKNGMKSPFLQTYPPGHFYSPISDIEKILNDKEPSTNRESKECMVIDL